MIFYDENEENKFLDESEDLDLTHDDLCEKMKSYSSEYLAEIVITYKYIGLHKNVAIFAMQELSSRRSLGDNFNYEEYIESGVKSLPSLDLKVPDTSIFNGIVNNFGFNQENDK